MLAVEVQNLTHSINNKKILNNINFNLDKDSISCILGPSGSGKTTLLKLIAGLEKVQSGKISINGEEVSSVYKHLPTEKRKIGFLFQDYALFPHLTVKQNLLLGAWHPKAKDKLTSSLEKIYKIFPKLETRSEQLAKTMSGGEQQMLAIARGMMGLPKLLMVDEPFLGLSPIVMKDLIQIFKNIVKEGISILFVEQNVRLALSMADRGYVLESGRLVIDGKSEDLIDNEKVTKVFLGN